MPPRLKLFIPGPTEVRPDVLEAMAKPPISHRGSEIVTLQRSVEEQAARIMLTGAPILLSTSSATGLMEAAIRNGVQRRVLCLVCGAFSRRWHTIALDCGKQADALEEPWGRAIRPDAVDAALSGGRYDALTLVHNETSTGVANPLEEIAAVMRKHPDVVFMVDTVSSLGGMPVKVDDFGIDFCLASVQKALALPPGFSLCSVSERMLERSRKAAAKGYYFDLVRMHDKARQGQPLVTPSVSHMYAMQRQFAHILEEGLQNRWNRHHRTAAMVRDWAKDRFGLYADEAHASDTLTCVANTRGISIAALIADLERQGALIGSGYGSAREKSFRIAHLGEITQEDITPILSMIDRFLRKNS
ncbi:MAG: pyridoxal-phosphate-dependent aminotransferase family protein [Acidobacteriota bacterium]